MFEKRYFYYLVKFEDEKTYWYRSNQPNYKSGMKVIVPVSNNGLWKIGTVTEVHIIHTDNVPYPLIRTKGIVQKAGFFARSKVDQHNNEISRSKYPPIDISLADVETANGKVVYCTCPRERQLHRELVSINQEPFILIENYPPSPEKDIPIEAQKNLKKRLKGIEKAKQRYKKKIDRIKRDRELEYWNDFDELMEELDQYN